MLDDDPALSDPELTSLAAGGDRDAFATIYRRHVGALFDFAARLVGDREAAADIVQTTFVKTWDALTAPATAPGESRLPILNVRAWMFTLARNSSMDELRRRKQLAPGTDDDTAASELADASRLADPAATVEDGDLAALVWECATALSPADRSLLDLHLRQGLSVGELAEALELRTGAVYTRLSRLRNALGDAVVGLLVSRHGRSRCDELDDELSHLGADAPARRVQRVTRAHIRRCVQCQATAGLVASPAALFSSVAPISLSLDRCDDLWKAIDGMLGSSPSPSSSGRHRHRNRRRLRQAVAVAVALALGVATAVLAFDTSPDAVDDPTDSASTSHEVGQVSTLRRITVRWVPEPRATGYSVAWNADPATRPDGVVDLPGTAAGVTSPELGPGAWWFTLRTRGQADRWTSTVVLGPFVIVGPDPDPFQITPPASQPAPDGLPPPPSSEPEVTVPAQSPAATPPAARPVVPSTTPVPAEEPEAETTTSTTTPPTTSSSTSSSTTSSTSTSTSTSTTSSTTTPRSILG